MNQKPSQDLPFENSLSRLEQILEKMNSGAIALEDALKLYEEADQLIASCNKRLNEAERKIDILIKNQFFIIFSTKSIYLNIAREDILGSSFAFFCDNMQEYRS